MGRPPLSRVENDVTVKTTIRYPKSLKDRIEAAVAGKSVAEFFRDCAEAELVRLERAAKRKPDPDA